MVGIKQNGVRLVVVIVLLAVMSCVKTPTEPAPIYGTMELFNGSGKDMTLIQIRPAGSSDWENLSSRIQGYTLKSNMYVTIDQITEGSKDLQFSYSDGTNSSHLNKVAISSNTIAQVEKTPTGLNVSYASIGSTGGNTGGGGNITSSTCTDCNTTPYYTDPGARCPTLKICNCPGVIGYCSTDGKTWSWNNAAEMQQAMTNMTNYCAQFHQ